VVDNRVPKGVPPSFRNGDVVTVEWLDPSKLYVKVEGYNNSWRVDRFKPYIEPEQAAPELQIGDEVEVLKGRYQGKKGFIYSTGDAFDWRVDIGDGHKRPMDTIILKFLSRPETKTPKVKLQPFRVPNLCLKLISRPAENANAAMIARDEVQPIAKPEPVEPIKPVNIPELHRGLLVCDDSLLRKWPGDK
jgi:hypothetical protein